MLILFAFAIFLAVMLSLRWIENVKTGNHLKSKTRVRWIFYIYCILVGIFFLLSAYYAIAGQRPLIWFFIFALIGILSLYFGNSFTPKQRGFSILVITILAVVNSSIPIIQNRGVIFGPDQWRDLKVTTFIMDKGTFQNAPELRTGYYAFIPLFNVLNAVISEIVGWPAMTTIAVMQGVLCLLSAISVYAIMMKLDGRAAVSLVAVMLLLSTPRLSTVQAIPATASISLGFLLVLLFVKENASFLRNIFLIVAILAFATTVFHPVGMFPILGVCMGTLLINHFSTRERLRARAISFTKRIFSICLIITLGYWSVDCQVFAGVFNPLRRFLLIFINFEASPSIYSPQYQSTGFELFSFAWALPVAFSAAYLVLIPRSGRKGKSWFNRDLRQNVTYIAALVGLLLILGAFFSVIINPGAAVERYINMTGYALLIFPSSCVFGRFLLSHKKAAVLFSVLLLSTNVVIGSSSPDWAPFENPAFGAFRSTFTSFIEANTIVTLLPNNTFLYEDHDIPVAGVARLRNMLLVTDRSYQTTRNVIQIFKNNSFSPFDTKYKAVVIVIKTDEIVDQRMFHNYINVVYNSKRHAAIIP